MCAHRLQILELFLASGSRRSTVEVVECLRPMKLRTKQYQNRIELLQGTLDMLILQILQWGPRHGYGIVQALRTESSEVLRWRPDRYILLCTD